MEAFVVALASVWADSGYSALTMGHCIMILVGLILLYMAIGKGFEPLLLSPIAFGCILANIPKNGFEEPGVMSVIAYGIHHEVFPPLIFLGVGAMTDFGPLLANPKTLLLGAAAQGGVFVALLGAMLSGFTVQQAAAIGIIGGADGPTSIYLAAKMAPELLGAIAVAAYSYMSLVPLIQPPIMKLFTTEADRKIVMKQLRPVSKFEKIAFPIMCTIVISLLLPSVTALVGMLMLGNLFANADKVVYAANLCKTGDFCVELFRFNASLEYVAENEHLPALFRVLATRHEGEGNVKRDDVGIVGVVDEGKSTLAFLDLHTHGNGFEGRKSPLNPPKGEVFISYRVEFFILGVY